MRADYAPAADAAAPAADAAAPAADAAAPTDPSAPADTEVTRLVLCSGKVAYDLIEARDAAGITDTQIIRIEQLYPFPHDPLVVRLKRMSGLKRVVWAQEEPKNNGAWSFVAPLIEEALAAAGVANDVLDSDEELFDDHEDHAHAQDSDADEDSDLEPIPLEETSHGRPKRSRR